MQNEEGPPRKLIVGGLGAMVLAVVGTSWLLYYLGMFSQPRVDLFQAPGYRIIYITHTGPYSDLQNAFDRAAALLREAGLPQTTPCAVFLDDPSVVPENELRSKVCYLAYTLDRVPAGLQAENIPPREVVRATFTGSPLVGSYKSYAAMKHWANEQGRRLALPAFEIYHEHGTVEYQLPLGAAVD